MKRRKIKAMGVILSACMITSTVMTPTAVAAAKENAESAYEINEERLEAVSREIELEPESDFEIEQEPPAVLPKAEMPQAEFDAATMTLSKVETGMKYSVDGGDTWMHITGTSADLGSTLLSPEKDIRVVRTGTENVTSDSDTQFLDLVKPAVPAQPEVTVAETIVTINAVDGQEYSFKEAADTAQAAWGSVVEFKDLKEGTDYEVNTRIAGKGLSLPSDVTTLTVKTKVTALTKPAGVKASMVDTGTIKVSWNEVVGAETYTIYRSDDDKKTYHAIATLKELTFTDTTQNGLVSGKNYYYKIAASKVVNGAAYNSDMSSVVRGFTKLETPKLSLQQINRANILTWTEVPNAQVYRVYRSTSKDKGYTKIATVSEPSYTDRDFSRDTNYYYKVRAVREESRTFYSLYSDIKYNKKIKTNKVIHTEKLGNKIRIIWAKYSKSNGVVVYMKKAGGKYAKADTFMDHTTRFTSTELSPGKYYFKVRFFRTFKGRRAYGAYSKVQKITIA